MKKNRIYIILALVFAVALALAGCRREGEANVDDMAQGGGDQQLTAQLATTWELYAPYGVWDAERMVLDPNGKVTLGDASGTWTSTNDTLTLNLDGQVMQYHYVLDGYQLILENSLYTMQMTFVAPSVFLTGQSDTGICGKWLEFPLSGNYLDIAEAGSYTSADMAGSYSYRNVYFARDGILRVYDETSGAHDYFGYVVQEGGQQLSLIQVGLDGMPEYTYVAKCPSSMYQGEWMMVVTAQDGVLPQRVTLNADGSGILYDGSSREFNWEAFYNGTMFINDKEGNPLDYEMDFSGGVLFVGNELGGAAMLVCLDQVQDTTSDGEFLRGTWKSENNACTFSLDERDYASIYLSGDDGQSYTVAGQAKYGNGLLVVQTDVGEQYFFYRMDGDVMSLSEAESIFEEVAIGWDLTKQ